MGASLRSRERRDCLWLPRDAAHWRPDALGACGQRYHQRGGADQHRRVHRPGDRALRGEHQQAAGAPKWPETHAQRDPTRHFRCPQDILPDTTLEWVWYDSRCDPNTATNALLDMINIWDVHAIIGPACDEVAIRVAPMATYWELPFISYGAAATALTQKDIYPDFARVNGNLRSRNELFLRFARIHGWEQLAL
eukprot:7451242-Prorocentrum_lima.AAC.1